MLLGLLSLAKSHGLPAGVYTLTVGGLLAEAARDYLVLPCALIRGALVHLGVECTVTADPNALPACDFTITIKPR